MFSQQSGGVVVRLGVFMFPRLWEPPVPMLSNKDYFTRIS